MSASDESIQKLTETVYTLAQALARSEARYRSIERVYRWMATGLVAMSAVVFYFGFDFVTRAYAQTSDAQQIAAAIQQLSERGVALNLGGTLQGIVQLGDMMQKDPAAMQRVGAVLGQITGQLAQVQVAPSHSPRWGWGLQAAGPGRSPGQSPGQSPLPPASPAQRAQAGPSQPKPPTPQSLPQPTSVATAGQPGGTLGGTQAPANAGPITLGEVTQDLAVLIANLKEDSDWLRQNTKPSMTIGQELARMNVTLAAVPAMAVEMHRMNIAMGVMTTAMGSMTQSVGSTMGRMGSMWPF